MGKRKLLVLMLGLLVALSVGTALAQPPMPVVYRLKVEIQGEGEVILDPEGDLAGGIYYYPSPQGEPITVQLTAVPADHWAFSHWEIGLGIPPTSTQQESDNPITITLSQENPDYTVKAVFQRVYRLKVEVVGEGHVSLQPGAAYVEDDVHFYFSPVTVTLEAIPNALGWVFDHWEINPWGEPAETRDENPTEIELTDAQPDWTAKAVFTQAPYYLITVSADPPEGGTVSGGGYYYHGTQVTLVATPNPCWEFVNWTEDGAVVSTEPTYVFTATANRNLVANFRFRQHTVTVSADPPEGGTVTGGGTYDCGTEVTVTAVPNECWEFVNWTEDGVVVSTDPSYTFILERDRNLTATFRIKTFTVTVEVQPPGGGTVEVQPNELDPTVPGYQYSCGTEVTLTAIPSEGYEFVGWAEGGVMIETDQVYTFVVNTDRELVAIFHPVGVPVTTTHLARGWNFVSIPLDPVPPVFADEIPDPYLWHWDPCVGRYTRVVDNTESTEVEPTNGYWLWVPADTTVEIDGVPITGDVEKPLGCKGWHQISAPWPYRREDILFTNGVETKTWEEAVAAYWIANVLWAYDIAQNRYENAQVLDPWKGHWLYTYEPNLTMILRYENVIPGAQSLGLRDVLSPASEQLPPPPPLPPVSDLEGSQVINEPNPVVDVHTTVFKVVGPAAAFVEAMRVRIFDASGRLVYEAEVEGPELVWHTQDLTGAYLANGVYLYRVEVKVAGQWITTEVKKLAIYR